MKITVVAGGVPTSEYPINGIFEYEQAKALKAAGNDVCYLALDFRPLKVKRHCGLKRFERDGIQIYHYSLPTGVYRRGLWFLRRLTLRIFRKILREQGVQDVLHAHFYSIGSLCSLIPLKTGVKMVVTEHSSKLHKPLSEISALDAGIARAAYDSASAVVAVSASLAKRLNENFGVTATVIGNIVNPAFAEVKHQKHAGFNILSVGRLVSGKRFDTLIRAFSLLTHADATLTIVGDGVERNSLESLVSELGLTSKVKFYGAAKPAEIMALMATTDLFALLSESETFGVSYAEALTAGIPVISSRCGGPEGFIINDNGVIVDSTEDAAKAIDKIIEGTLSFDTKKIKCSAAQFSPATVAQQLSELMLDGCRQ